MNILCFPGLSQCITIQVNRKIQHVVMTKEKSMWHLRGLYNGARSCVAFVVWNWSYIVLVILSYVIPEKMVGLCHS